MQPRTQPAAPSTGPALTHPLVVAVVRRTLFRGALSVSEGSAVNMGEWSFTWIFEFQKLLISKSDRHIRR